MHNQPKDRPRLQYNDYLNAVHNVHCLRSGNKDPVDDK